MREVPPEPMEEPVYADPHGGGSWGPHVDWSLGPLGRGEDKELVCTGDVQTNPSAGPARGLRLRKRGRLTNALEQAMEKSKGRWRDLANTGIQSRARAWLQGYCSPNLSKVELGELLVGRPVPLSKEQLEAGEKPISPFTPTVWVPFVGDNGCVRALLVSPQLVAELSVKRMFRSVTSVLIGSLRGRAAMWAAERGLPAEDLVRVLPGSLALAILPQPDEVHALAALRGAAGEYSSKVLASLEKGVLTAPASPPLGAFVRWPFSLLFGKTNTRLLAPGVGTLKLPA